MRSFALQWRPTGSARARKAMAANYITFDQPYRRNFLWIGTVVVLSLLFAWALQPFLLDIGLANRSWAAAFLALIASLAFGAVAYFSPFVLLIAGLPLIGFLLRTPQNDILSLRGLILWLSGAGFAFLLLMQLIAQFLLPRPGAATAQHAFSLLLESLFPQNKKKRHNVAPTKLPDTLAQFGVGYPESHETLVVTQPGKGVVPIEPGYVVLKRKQAISRQIDLRPIIGNEPVRATTIDGIPVDTTVYVRFQIRQPLHTVDENVPFPYDSNAIREAHRAETVREGNQRALWYERIATRASYYVVDQMARYSLDNLFPSEPQAVYPIERILDQVQRKLSAEFEPQGVAIGAVWLGQFVFPPNVADKRIKLWKGRWDNRIKLKEDSQRIGKGIRPMKVDEAKIRVEVLEELIGNMREMRAASSDPLSQQITYQIEEMLRIAAVDGVIRTLIPAPKDQGGQETKK